jgi:hypothetical protein
MRSSALTSVTFFDKLPPTGKLLLIAPSQTDDPNFFFLFDERGQSRADCPPG